MKLKIEVQHVMVIAASILGIKALADAGAAREKAETQLSECLDVSASIVDDCNDALDQCEVAPWRN